MKDKMKKDMSKPKLDVKEMEKKEDKKIMKPKKKK